MESWEKVYINLGRKSDVSELDYHMANMTCVSCHAGDNSKPNSMEDAHTGLIADPSEFDTQGTNSCSAAGCHETTAGTYKNSLHQKLWGEKKMVSTRSGVNSFAECPQATQDGFNGECASCHATCGDCHISIPNSAGKGLLNSHKFIRTPDQDNNCMACHGSRVAHDFKGDYENYPVRPGDVHADMYKCTDCHSKAEMHSDVPEGTDRYHYDEMPSCEESGCHVTDLDDANLYHTVHLKNDKLSCFVCHSQDYNNCTDCHVNHVWQTDPVYQNNNPEEDFKIALNPIRDESNPRLRFEFATVRHIPVAPNSFSYWDGAPTLPNYDALPSWKYTSPHSIRRFTARTDTSGGKRCAESCHAGIPENRKYYLFRDSVNARWPDEVNANESIFVDGHLPSGWFD